MPDSFPRVRRWAALAMIATAGLAACTSTGSAAGGPPSPAGTAAPTTAPTTPSSPPSSSPARPVTSTRTVTSTVTSGATTPPPTTGTSLAHFQGEWIGHTRSLLVGRDGRTREHVDDGCCTPVIDLTLRLTAEHKSGAGWVATGTVTSVTTHAGWGTEKAAPRVGQPISLTLRNDVIVEPLTGATYCGSKAEPGTCGA